MYVFVPPTPGEELGYDERKRRNILQPNRRIIDSVEISTDADVINPGNIPNVLYMVRDNLDPGERYFMVPFP